MAVLGKLIHRALRLRSSLPHRRHSPAAYQRIELRGLLSRARQTAFGRRFAYEAILASDDMVRAFQNRVPVYDYETLYDHWWHRTLEEEEDVTWPGRIPYFALTSGTSGAPSKHIPVSREMVRAVQNAGIKQIFSLAAFHLPNAMFEKGVLILGGSTQLRRQRSYFVGDLSGISAGQIPSWFQHFYKPGPDLAAQEDWNEKLEAITRQARAWDIGIICGVPSWVQMLLEKIIIHYELDTIHEIWPNLSVYIHGGVAFGPYRRTLRRLVDRPLVTIETYIASEGYIAFQQRPYSPMTMLLNNGIFFEFVPFDEYNFDPEGRIVDDPDVFTIDEVEEGTPYALLLSTCAGAWRYLIGDVIQFTDRERGEIIITGRTRHFLSLCGEHLSIDNMARAVEMLEKQFDLAIPEFTAAGIAENGRFSHRWFLGTDGTVDAADVQRRLDDNLRRVNDDYATKRGGPLRRPEVEIIPVSCFNNWMERRGKLGGQNKFPRVLNQDQVSDWETFLETKRSGGTTSE